MSKIFYVLFVLAMLPGTGHAQSSLINVAERAERSLVEVKTVYMKVLHGADADAESGGRGRVVSYERSGAGIVIDPAGIIVTNTHVVINAPHIFVVLRDGTKLEASVAYVSPTYDFTLLKVDPPSPLRPIAWADSSQAELGQAIFGIGSSDYDNQGILGGQIKSLVQSRSEGTIEFIVLDLNLYKGDSGGPILNTQGRLLGIVMAKDKNEDRTSLAIASDKIREQYLRYKQRTQ